jgi:hypothetical protein
MFYGSAISEFFNRVQEIQNSDFALKMRVL